MNDLTAFGALVPLDHGLCVLSTARTDGTVQSSVVNAGVLRHPLTGDDVVSLVAAGGTHDDWAAYDRAMADERRAAVLITPTRSYGN